MERALKKLGLEPYRVPGFLSKPHEAIEKLGPIDDPTIGIFVHWVDGPHTTDGVVGKDTPLLLASNDPQAYAEWSAATAVGEMVEPERVDCPTLALCGELDPVTPPAFSETLAAAIPRARAAVVEGAAHWCQLEATAAVSALLLEFLDEIAT